MISTVYLFLAALCLAILFFTSAVFRRFGKLGFFLFLFIAAFLRASVMEAFRVPSAAMAPTIVPGDHILVSKLSYGLWTIRRKTALFQMSDVQRGDIVVFTLPEEPNVNIIKRVVGLPGEIIELRGTNLLVNGNPLGEDYAKYVHGGIENYGPIKIPDGHVFVLGDNRDQSKDSRFWPNPFVPVERIKGRAILKYLNIQPSTEEVTFASAWLSRLKYPQ